ncbi:GntR family transcriptional regulator [Virgibacillus sp. NKC19-16]|uniref:GntR family transcriptional regulator n=1 Tax=Virgibacillus salidurans TaxID=2831673 RepID=UPI001F352DD9|nr:GntR family transcriptional regulator [Virgibacillus sp. NKC19-16]UJL47406.1 GntR family transcriptional regulator [Virgibacillus sp. NKC19-16]
MSNLSLEKREPYYVQFYHMIKQMIFEGKYQPEERINETQLAKEYNVSKSPIREAIRILENEGLLVVDKSKVIVYKPTLKDVMDIYQCRMALESFAVKLTTKIATDAELKDIEDTLKTTETAIQAEEESNKIISLNENFHHLILTYCRNSRLQKQVNNLKALINYFRILNFKGELRAKEILGQHRKIFDYIEQRDEISASTEMIKHLELDVKHLMEILNVTEEKT